MRYPEKVHRQAIDLYHSGLTYRKVAEQVKTTPHTVWLWVHKESNNKNNNITNDNKINSMTYGAISNNENTTKLILDLPNDPKILKKLLIECYTQENIYRLENRILKAEKKNSVLQYKTNHNKNNHNNHN